jgi:hypothetical protein
MPLWDTVMIALVIGSTIAFCFWARIRATGGDSRDWGGTDDRGQRGEAAGVGAQRQGERVSADSSRSSQYEAR